jgi:hypothetical protein
MTFDIFEKNKNRFLVTNTRRDELDVPLRQLGLTWPGTLCRLSMTGRCPRCPARRPANGAGSFGLNELGFSLDSFG